MDTQSILIFNLILNILVVFDHFLIKLKSSSCLGKHGLNFEMKDDIKNNHNRKDSIVIKKLDDIIKNINNDEVIIKIDNDVVNKIR